MAFTRFPFELAPPQQPLPSRATVLGRVNFSSHSIMSDNCVSSCFWFPPPSSLFLRAYSKRACSVISPPSAQALTFSLGPLGIFMITMILAPGSFVLAHVCSAEALLPPPTPSGARESFSQHHSPSLYRNAVYSIPPLWSATPGPSPGLAVLVRNRLSLDASEQLPLLSQNILPSTAPGFSASPPSMITPTSSNQPSRV